MTNPKFLVNISYVPMFRTGSVGTYATQSDGSSLLTATTDTYGGGYFVSSMPEVKLYATGSTYQTALTNVLNLATASIFDGNGVQPRF